MERRPATPACRSASTSRVGRGPELSYQIGKWQAGRVRDDHAAPARRDPRDTDLLRGPRTSSRAADRDGGVGRRLAAVLPGARRHGVARLRGARSTTAPALSPSELFARQVIATFEEDVLPRADPRARRRPCMWASDYPHTDSTFPESRRVIDETLGELTEDDRRKVTATNCAELYAGAGSERPTSMTQRQSGISPGSTTCRSRCANADAMVAFYRVARPRRRRDRAPRGGASSATRW